MDTFRERCDIRHPAPLCGPILLDHNRRVPGLSCEGCDIVEQLNYVASQLSAVTKNPNWGLVHARVLEEAAREIRRLRSVIYAPPGVAPLGPRPADQFIGTPTAFDPAAYFSAVSSRHPSHPEIRDA